MIYDLISGGWDLWQVIGLVLVACYARQIWSETCGN